MVITLFGALTYFAYLSFVPQSKKPRTKRTTPVTPSVGSPTTTVGSGGYQEEWIPEHHLKKAKPGRRTAGGTSGEELSGGEVSGAESRKRKGRK